MSYREMALAQRSLTQHWCAGDKEGRRGKEESGSATSWREEFSADDLVKTFGGFFWSQALPPVTHRAWEEPSNDRTTRVFPQNYHILCSLLQSMMMMMCSPLVSCREEGPGTIIPTSGQVATSCGELLSFSLT